MSQALTLKSEAALGQGGGSPGRSRKWHSPGSAICFLISSNTRELRFSSHTLGWGSGGASSSRVDLEYRRRQDPERRKVWGSRFLRACVRFCLFVCLFVCLVLRAKALTWWEPLCPKQSCLCLALANWSQHLGFCPDPRIVNLSSSPQTRPRQIRVVPFYLRAHSPSFLSLTLRSSSPESMTCWMEGREKEKSASQ
jgi:hypothetical protein